MSRPANPRLSTITPPLHTFDIDRSSVAVSLWRHIERRNRSGVPSVSPSPLAIEGQPIPSELPPQSFVDSHLNRPVSGAEPLYDERRREHYFHVTNPPNMAYETKIDAATTTQSTPSNTELEPDHITSLSNPLVKSHAPELAELTQHWGSLSYQGRKQAAEAGLRLGCSVMRPMSHSPARNPEKKEHHDRWAAYSHTKSTPQPHNTEMPRAHQLFSGGGTELNEQWGRLDLEETERAEAPKQWGSLSLQGSKQAAEAGLKLGSSVKRPSSHSPPGNIEKKAHHDRWAAYSQASTIMRSHDIKAPTEEQSVNSEGAETNKQWGSLTSEGRKQAEEAGTRLGSSVRRPLSRNLPGNRQTKAHQNRWAAYSQSSPTLRPQDDKTFTAHQPFSAEGPGESDESRRPLLEVFEAELAKLISDPSVPSGAEKSAPHPELTTEFNTSEPNSAPKTSKCTDEEAQDSPVEVLGNAVRGFLDGIGILASEFRSNLPEAHDHFTNVQQRLPQTVQRTVQTAFRGIEGQVHRIANNVQLVSVSTRNAAERTRGIDTQVLDGLVSGLSGFASGIGDIGGALFPATNSESVVEPPGGRSGEPAESVAPPVGLKQQTDDSSKDEPTTLSIVPSTTAPTQAKNSDNSDLASPIARITSTASSSDSKPNHTNAQYEEIHRILREAEADIRKADPQKKKEILQQLERANKQPLSASSTNSGEGRHNRVHNIGPEQGQEQYDQVNTSRTPVATSVITDRASCHSKVCPSGCTSGPFCRHRRAAGGVPYPSRNDSYRNRHARRSPLHSTYQLPYEYVVPPPGFYSPRASGSRASAGIRFAPTRPGQPTQPGHDDSPWPESPQYGPIHLPRSSHQEADIAWTSRLPHSESTRLPTPSNNAWASRSARNPRPTTPPDPKLELCAHTVPAANRRASNHGSPASNDPTFTTSCMRCYPTPLRHRQSWHPSSANKVPESSSTVRPERPTVSFAEPPDACPPSRKSSHTWSKTVQDRRSVEPSDTRPLLTTPPQSSNNAVRYRRSTGALGAREPSDSIPRDVPSRTFGPRSESSHVMGQAMSASSLDLWNQHAHGGNRTESHASYGHMGDEKAGRLAQAPLDFISPWNFVDSTRHSTQHSLYPPLINDTALVKNAGAGALSGAKGKHDEVSNLPSLSSVLESLPPKGMTMKETSFPTLAQFENENSKQPSPFPPLPTMEPLIPVRTNTQLNDAPTSDRAMKAQSDFAVQTRPVRCSRAWSTKARALEMNESSGEFFRRMTGLETSPKDVLDSDNQVQPARADKLQAGHEEARLGRPSDPLAESVTLHRSRLIDGVRRNITERRPYHEYHAGNRRPYSDYFTGNGRLGWESFLANQDGASRRQAVIPKAEVSSAPAQPRIVPKVAEAIPKPNTFTHNKIWEHDAHKVTQVQNCVDQLKNLGFGTSEDGGVDRLLVYAQAAKGHVGDAIDIIEEERKAYRQRNAV